MVLNVMIIKFANWIKHSMDSNRQQYVGLKLSKKVLIEKGFQNLSVDRCIYLSGRGDVWKNIYVVLFVDDLVIAAADIQTTNNFKGYLMNRFRMSDLKDMKLFLGIKVEEMEARLR